MLIGLLQQISKFSNPSLFLPSNHPIMPTDSACNLGFMFDSSIMFFKQISSLSSACNYHIHNLRHLRYTLDLKTASVIATSLAHSKLDYDNSLYLNLPQKQISWLQLLQNSLARAVTGILKTEHHPCTQISALAQNRSAYPLQKIISFTYDLLHTSQPQYLRKLINIKPISFTRSSDHLILLCPATSYLKISNHSFNQTTPMLCNNLPKSENFR